MPRPSNRKTVVVPLPPASTMPALFDIYRPPCPPQKNIWLESWNGMLSRRRLRKKYHAILMHIGRLPIDLATLGAGAIFCSNSATADDCAIAHYILRRHLMLDPYFILDEAEIAEQPSLSRLGALGVNYRDGEGLVKSLHYAAELVRGVDLPGLLPLQPTRPRGLWLRPTDEKLTQKAGVIRCRTVVARLVRFASGLKDDTGKDTLRPPASIGHPRMSARLRRAQMNPAVIPVIIHQVPTEPEDGGPGLQGPLPPSLYIDFGEPWEINEFNISIQAWTHLLEERMNALLQESTLRLKESPPAGYERIVK